MSKSRKKNQSTSYKKLKNHAEKRIKEHKQKTLRETLDSLDNIPLKAVVGTILILGNFAGKFDITLYGLYGQYWILRKDLEKIYSGIVSRFSDLCNEYIPDFNCFWLEQDIDYKRVNKGFFYQIFHPSEILMDIEKGQEYILLSIEGSLKLLSRSSKMKDINFWLIKKYMEFKLLNFEGMEFINNTMVIVSEMADTIKKQDGFSAFLLEKITLQAIKLLNIEIYDWYSKYNKPLDYHPHRDIRKLEFTDRAKELHRILNKVRNKDKSKIVCGICKKIIKKNEEWLIHHYWTVEDYHSKRVWKVYFDPKECGIVHKNCHPSTPIEKTPLQKKEKKKEKVNPITGFRLK